MPLIVGGKQGGSSLSQGISMKIDLIARLEFELVYFEVAVKYFSHYATSLNTYNIEKEFILVCHSTCCSKVVLCLSYDQFHPSSNPSFNFFYYVLSFVFFWRTCLHYMQVLSGPPYE